MDVLAVDTGGYLHRLRTPDGWRHVRAAERLTEAQVRHRLGLPVTLDVERPHVAPVAAADPRLVGVLGHGWLGGGAERSTARLVDQLGGRLIGTAWLPDRPATYEPVGVPYVPPDQLEAALDDADIVIDDGCGHLGGPHLLVERPIVQTVRCANDVVAEAITRPAAARVYTSHGLASYYRDRLRHGDHIIPNGVPVPDEVGPKEPCLAVIVARLVKERGVREMLQHRPHGARVIVCGDGPERADLERDFAIPEVEFVGHVDPDPYYRRAEIALAWSGYAQEGTFRVPIEAAAHGCAVVCSPAGDVPRLLPHTVAAHVHTPEQLGEWWAKLRRDADHRRRMGEAARRLGRLYDERIAAARWRWLVQRLRGGVPDSPRVTVGLCHSGDRRRHLAISIASWRQQTIPVRVVVLHDVNSPETHSQASMRSWLGRHFPGVVYAPVAYDHEPTWNVCKVRNRLFDWQGRSDILIWCDGDSFVAGDCAEQVAAQWTVYPRAVPCFARQRCLLLDQLPQPLLEPVIQAAITPVDDPAGRQHKTPAWVAQAIGTPGPSTPYWMWSGMVTGGPAATAVRWDESLWGWGGDENLWGAAMLAAGHEPGIGPMAWHQEHDVPDAAERARTSEINREAGWKKLGWEGS